MRRNSTSSLGAFHPVLFFLFVYGISLFLAIFVCRTVYDSLNEQPAGNVLQLQDADQPALAATAMR